MKKLKLAVIALVGVLVFTLTGCSNGYTFTEKSYSGGENEIKKIAVLVEDRELEIGASEDNQIHIDYHDGEKEFLEITVSESKELTVKLVYQKDRTNFIGVKPSAEYRTIMIRIPDDLIETLSIKTTNENIKVNALTFTENLSLDTNGGNIVCDRVGVGKAVSLAAKDGNLTGSVIGGWDDFSISC